MDETSLITTDLTRVTPDTLAELLLGYTREQLREIAKAYHIRIGRDKYHTIANIMMARDRLRGNIRICIERP